MIHLVPGKWALLLAALASLQGCTSLSPHAPSVSTGELLINGKLTTATDPWWSAGATLKVEDGMGCASFKQQGSNPWDVIFGQSGFVLQKGGAYKLSFKVRAKDSARMRLVVQHDGPPYTAYLAQEVDVGSGLRSYQFAFTQPAADDKTTFQFQMGAQIPNTICFSDITLTGPRGSSVPAPESAGLPVVRTNQLGYLSKALKRASIASNAKEPLAWQLRDADGRTLAEGKTTLYGANESSGESIHIADFSSVTAPARGVVLEVAGNKSHPFAIGDDIYRPMKYDALSFFYQQRSGIDIAPEYVQRADLARPAGHKPEKVSCFKGMDDKGNRWPGCDFSLDVTGGWYDAGDQGKYVVNGGISVWTLMNLYERSQLVKSADKLAFSDGKVKIPENSNGKNDLLDESRWMMDFMLAMQVPDGKKAWVPVGNQLSHINSLTLTEIDASGMVFHKIADEKWTGLPTPPHKDPQARSLSHPGTAATLNLAATAAQCARVWKEQDAGYAKRCLVAAERAWEAAARHPDVYAYDNFTGSGPYEDYTLSDEFYWAAAELFATTGKPVYEKSLKASPHYLASAKGDIEQTDELFWAKLGVAGTITLASTPNKLDRADVDKARKNLIATADAYQAQSAQDGYLLPFKAKEYSWGSNSAVLNRSLILGQAYDLTGDRKYLQAIADSMDYILGRNPLDQSYVSGYGARPLKNPHHRFWSYQNSSSSPMVPPGVLSGGPNSESFSDPVATKLKGKCVKQTCWVDDIGAWTLNEVTVNWNAPLLWTVSILDEGGLSR